MGVVWAPTRQGERTRLKEDWEFSRLSWNPPKAPTFVGERHEVSLVSGCNCSLSLVLDGDCNPGAPRPGDNNGELPRLDGDLRPFPLVGDRKFLSLEGERREFLLVGDWKASLPEGDCLTNLVGDASCGLPPRLGDCIPSNLLDGDLRPWAPLLGEWKVLVLPRGDLTPAADEVDDLKERDRVGDCGF